MNDSKEKKEQTPKRKPNLILIGIVIVLVWLAMWSTDKDGGDSRPATVTSKSKKPAVKSLEQVTKGLGKTLAIGERALGLKAEGTQILDAAKIDGLAERLEGRDVDAVTDLLEQAGIKHVLVDPDIARRNPMPQNTVKNRLALARPAGRLSAKYMTRKLFYYRLGDPPLEIPKEAKQALTAIARASFGGEETTLPGLPEIVTKKGNWTMMMTVRPVQSGHISYHANSAKTLAEAAAELGKQGRQYYTKRKRFEKKYGPVEVALPKVITLELEVLYDEGTFVGPRDNLFLWRIIDPGIHGIRMNVGGRTHYLPPWYSVANNMRTVKSLFERVSSHLGGREKDYWKRPDAPFDRFRTVHWRETIPSGPVEDLYRFSPHVPSMKEVTRENMVKAIKGLGDWIADNQTDPEGRYVYRYFPTQDKENDEYNMVRHCLGPFSLALTQEFAPNPKYKEKAEAGMRYIEKHLRWGGPPRKGDGTVDTSLKTWMNKPLPGKDVAILDFPEPPRGNWSAKLGGVAVAILGYTQYRRAGWALGPEREKVLNGLANFLLYMQNPEEGNFHHYYVAPENHFYGTRNSIYPGEILYAVARLYGETKDERYRTAFKQSMKANLEWFKGQMAQRLPDGTYEEQHRKNLVQFQPWMAMAMDEMYRYDPDPSYVEASNLVSLWILDTYQFDETRAFIPDYLGGYMKVMDELPAMHSFVYTEGVAASYDLAKRAGVEKSIVDKLRKGALLTARFLIQQQVRPGVNDFFYPNPKKAAGAVRYCMNHNKQRIDYTYHALSSAYRILRASTEEDYALAAQIPMPGRW